MRTRSCFAAGVFGLLSLGVMARADGESAPVKAGTLIVELTGFDSDRGDVKVALYTPRAADAFPDGFKHAKRFLKVPIKGRRASLRVRGLPYGTYAVSAFHDEDGDGQLDTAPIIGIPTEAVGASRNPGGKPDFEDSRFELSSPEHRIRIKLSTVL